jgi:hypothetical protein
MVRWWTLAIGGLGLAAAGAVDAAPTIDIALAAASWGPRFILTGTKTEPTYIEHIRLERNGDVFIRRAEHRPEWRPAVKALRSAPMACCSTSTALQE